MARASDIIKALKRAARELHKGMPPSRPQGPPKGKKQYNRKRKHPHMETDR